MTDVICPDRSSSPAPGAFWKREDSDSKEEGTGAAHRTAYTHDPAQLTLHTASGHSLRHLAAARVAVIAPLYRRWVNSPAGVEWAGKPGTGLQQ